MKVGDKVILTKYYEHRIESKDYALAENIPLNVSLTISEVDPQWIKIKGFQFWHPIEKFTFVKEEIPCVKKKPKIGDVLMLTHYHKYSPQEESDWSAIGKLPLNSPLTVTNVIKTETGTWVQFDKGTNNLSHAFGKFVPYTETKTENKMENCKIYVPTTILSELVQKKLFELGIIWNSGDQNVRKEWDTLEVHDGRIAAWNYLKEETITAKELLGDFDWCLKMETLSAKQKQMYCDKRGYQFSEFQKYHGRRNNGWDGSSTKWETELDWESFVHLYSIQEVIPQVEEYSQIEQTTNNMKFKIGDEVEFITEDKYVPSHSTSRKLDAYIKHGSTIFKENKGIINAIVEECYMVEYTDENNRKVQLGFKENVLQLKTQTTMKSQYLTRDQLIILLNQFDCPTWEDEIKKLLTGHEFSIGETKIDVTASVSKLISEGTVNQKSAVQALGILLVVDKSVTIPEFSTLYSGASKLIEVRCSENPDFDKKSFYLGRDFNWEIKSDDGILCLVPTKK